MASYMNKCKLQHICRLSLLFRFKNRSIDFCRFLQSYVDNSRKIKAIDVKENKDLLSGPSLKTFLDIEIQNDGLRKSDIDNGQYYQTSHQTSNKQFKTNEENIPYLKPYLYRGRNRKVYFETYGCQMNVSDTEVAWSILRKNDFARTEDISQADVVLLVTCAIREGAEDKIWGRLERLKHLKRRRQFTNKSHPLMIGILGCMAERLKSKLVEREKMVDVVCGPDSYRDLPRMLAITESNQAAVNVLLSLDETYADIVPVRLNKDSKSAFVSIMRGCDNLCSYCIVPFTRGRERSRPLMSILDEVRALSDQGVKEVTLLGQNVNSYRDMSERMVYMNTKTNLSADFNSIYKPKKGGMRFADLLDRVSDVDKEMRIRFTSPHPKDFPDEVLNLIRDRSNICRQIHLPAQSGSNKVLENMRRCYSREAYLDLVDHIHDVLPGVSLSSDFIAGFCGETEQCHQESLSLLQQVKYNFAYCFPYSMREKTRAFHRLTDDVPNSVKSRRHLQLISVFRQEVLKVHQRQIGSHQLVLVEGDSKRSEYDLSGRNEGNTRVIFPKTDLPNSISSTVEYRPMERGDYVVIQIVSCSSQILKGVPLYHTTLQDFYHRTNELSENCVTIYS